MKMNLKKNIKNGNSMKRIMNDIPDLFLSNEKNIKTELNKYQNNAEQMTINNKNKMTRNERNELKKLSFETNPNSTPLKIKKNKNKNKIGLKSYMEEVDNPKLRLYEQYYKYEGEDQLSDENITFSIKRRISKKFSVNSENSIKAKLIKKS